MYVILFGLALLASIVLIEGTYLAQVLGHPVGPPRISSWCGCPFLWASSPGDLGSSVEDEERVRRATYSRRERERQQRNRERAAEAEGRCDP